MSISRGGLCRGSAGDSVAWVNDGIVSGCERAPACVYMCSRSLSSRCACVHAGHTHLSRIVVGDCEEFEGGLSILEARLGAAQKQIRAPC